MTVESPKPSDASSLGRRLLGKVIIWSALATLAIATIGGGLGFLAAQLNGLVSALLGSAIAFVFSLITVLSVVFGSRLNLAGFYGLVLGSWLLKVIVFAAVLVVLQTAEFVHGPTFFFALVAAVIAGLGIDSWVALRGRIPITNQ